MKKEVSVSDVLEIIKDIKERAERDLPKTKAVGGHGCYGAGVDWGNIDACERILEQIEDLEQETS